ncbi:MAG: D-alanine--D-alanine ligase family protein [Acidimicrobiia bacterium]
MSSVSPIRLVVLFGGRSAEHDISRITARHVLAAADPDRYDLVAVGITREGRWVRVHLDPDSTRWGESLEIVGDEVDPWSLLTPDTVVMPLLHGPMGEDGTVQGLLETAGVAYVGSGVLASAVAMDKIVAKRLAAEAGVAQAGWRALHADDMSAPDAGEVLDTIATALGYPMFVKPANMGSSIGVSKVVDRAGLRPAIDAALAHDEWIVLEEGVSGREIEVAVLGHTNSPRASVPGEIVAAAEFYDFDDKYSDGAAELHVPAALDPSAADEVRRLACAVFRSHRAEGMARVDFFYEEGGRGWLLNELNTIPGFTPISMYPRLWQATGLTYRALIDELVGLAIERHASTRRWRTA